MESAAEAIDTQQEEDTNSVLRNMLHGSRFNKDGGLGMSQPFNVCRRCATLVLVDQDEEEVHSFLLQHVSHGIERATRSSTPAVYDRPLWDPMVTSWFEVAIGSEVLVVQSGRSSIWEPRWFRLHDGVIEREAATIQIDRERLRSAVELFFAAREVGSTKTGQFLCAVDDVIATADPEEVEPSFDDADDPERASAGLPAWAATALRKRCQSLFDTEEYERLSGFIEQNRSEYDALALLVRRPATVCRATGVARSRQGCAVEEKDAAQEENGPDDRELPAEFFYLAWDNLGKTRISVGNSLT